MRIDKEHIGVAIMGHLQEASDPDKLVESLDIDDDAFKAMLKSMLMERRDSTVKKKSGASRATVYLAGVIDGFTLAVKAIMAQTHLRCVRCGTWSELPDGQTMEEWREERDAKIEQVREKASEATGHDLSDAEVHAVTMCPECQAELSVRASAPMN